MRNKFRLASVSARDHGLMFGKRVRFQRGIAGETISIRWRWTLEHALFEPRQQRWITAAVTDVCKQPPGQPKPARLAPATEPTVYFNLSEATWTALGEARVIDEPEGKPCPTCPKTDAPEFAYELTDDLEVAS